MQTECPKCGWSKEVPEQARGKKGECPECGKVFTITEAIPEQDETVKASVQLEGGQSASEKRDEEASRDQEDTGKPLDTEDTKTEQSAESATGPLEDTKDKQSRHWDDVSANPIFADQVLRVLAWINFCGALIGGIVLLVQGVHGKYGVKPDPLKITFGIATLWFSFIGTAFLLTIVQIARSHRTRTGTQNDGSSVKGSEDAMEE